MEVVKVMITVAKNSSNNISKNKIVVSFVQAIKRRLDRNLVEIWLFGSYARGDYTPDSDYDMLIVVEGDISGNKKIVLEEEYKLLVEKEELVVSTIYNPETWALDYNSPLGWNICKEGIRLL